MAVCSSYKLLVDGLGFCFHLIPKLVECFEGGFATGGSKVGSLEEVVFVINISYHGR